MSWAGSRGFRAGQTHAMETGWYDGIAEGIRLQSTADDEGGTWVLFLNEDRRPVNALALSPDGLEPLDLDGLVQIVDDVDAPAVIVAVRDPMANRAPKTGTCGRNCESGWLLLDPN